MPALIIGNWKMYLNYTESVAWFAKHSNELQILQQQRGHTLIICPSYDSLSSIASTIQPRKLALGAQDCSAYANGPYTSQVSAQSLKEIGCSYVLIGHSETRKNLKGTIEASLLKTKQALAHDLTPIICIGESQDKYKAGTTLKFIEEQIRPILELYKINHPEKQLVIAYEPMWSIGTGVIPSNEHLETVYSYLIKRASKIGIQRAPLLLYGGSVDEANISTLKKVPQINGYLIGKASTDFQKFKKIVELIY